MSFKLLSQIIKDKIREHCEREFPNEACGLITTGKKGVLVTECKNSSDNPEKEFLINNEDGLLAETKGRVVAFYHSHSDSSSGFSNTDKMVSEYLNKVCILYNFRDFLVYEPIGREIPYVGRPFLAGTFDCYTLVRDYYRNEFNINLMEFEHEVRYIQNWKKNVDILKKYNYKGNDTIKKFLEKCDFVEVPSPIKNDILINLVDGLLMGAHFSIYLGNNVLTQDFVGSRYRTFDDKLKRKVLHVMRHRNFIK